MLFFLFHLQFTKTQGQTKAEKAAGFPPATNHLFMQK